MKQRKYVLETLISKFYANTTTDYQKSVLVTENHADIWVTVLGTVK